MNIKTPPGTVPLMDYQNSMMGWHDPHEIDDHPGGKKCLEGNKWDCQHIGFRVVDAEKFEAWLRSQTIRPNMHEIKHEPVSSFEVEWKEKKA